MFPSIESSKGSFSPTAGADLSALLSRDEAHYSSQDEASGHFSPKAARTMYVRALFDFKARSDGEMGFNEGAIILLQEKVECLVLCNW